MPITLTQTKNNEVVNETDLTKIIQGLNTGLSALEKNNVNSEFSQTTQIITYALIATAVVGIFVYHYIKSQETN